MHHLLENVLFGVQLPHTYAWFDLTLAKPSERCTWKEQNSNVALNKWSVKLDNNNSTQTKVIEISSRMNVMDMKELKGNFIKNLLMNTMSIRKTTLKFYKYRKDPQKHKRTT